VKLAILPLDATEVLLFLFLLQLALAPDDEGVVLDADINIEVSGETRAWAILRFAPVR
jgi:hypothetical protein